mmetsp:Transcript_10360/g.11831  ORF Transcript_10360/g.11831 Transcript_10360/m.11831 type:complete len:261 (-) Transcript_10360:245-1027(-)
MIRVGKKHNSFDITAFMLAFIVTLLLAIQPTTSDIVGCEELRKIEQEIPDIAYWTNLRDAYAKVMTTEYSTIDWQLSSKNNSDELLTGLLVPFEVKMIDEKGRGVYATQFIAKGSPIWIPKYQAVFEHDEQEDFEDFLSMVTWKQACDLLQWCYGYEDDDDDDDENYEEDDNEEEVTNVGVACVLDEGSLFNHGEEEANVGYFLSWELDDMIALRDIQAGEELIQDYDTFDESIDWFERLVDKAWVDDSENSEHSYRKEL